jgi:hypothetical protein
MPWFNSPGQQGGNMWATNGPQTPQIQNAPAQSPIWGGQSPSQRLGTLGMIGQYGSGLFGSLLSGGARPQLPQWPQQAPMPMPPAYGREMVPGNEQWQRGPVSGPGGTVSGPGGLLVPQQPTGPREAPEAHPGMADRQAGQWAAPGGGGLFGQRDKDGFLLDRNGNPIPDTGPGGMTGRPWGPIVGGTLGSMGRRF